MRLGDSIERGSKKITCLTHANTVELCLRLAFRYRLRSIGWELLNDFSKYRRVIAYFRLTLQLKPALVKVITLAVIPYVYCVLQNLLFFFLCHIALSFDNFYNRTIQNRTETLRLNRGILSVYLFK